ncbi:heptaprenyl diphosphate synthase [Sporolactobacillus sp. THM7-4]|nr:heptaprenyl diphosphate synthase [Sporolactobacillus sp. THM7-4]
MQEKIEKYGGAAMTASEEIELIHHRLSEYLNHPYVSRFLPKPEIDKDKMSVYYFLFQLRTEPENVGSFVESAMVAEIGLSTHESMTNGTLETKHGVTKRQLTALSGDFYSALYYYSLARKDDIEVVKWIAEAIQSFNVNKCRLYYPNHSQNWNQALEALGAVESALVTRIASKLGYTSWASFLNDFFLVKKLILEHRKYSVKDSGSILFNYLMKRFTGDTETFEQRLENEIRHLKARFFTRIGQEENRSDSPFQLVPYLKDKMQAYCQCKVGEG